MLRHASLFPECLPLFRPDEGFRVCVVMVSVVLDRLSQRFHAADGPLCCVRWFFLRRLTKDLSLFVRSHTGHSTTSRCIFFQSFQPTFGKSTSSRPCRSTRAFQFRSDVLVRLSSRSCQHNLCPQHQSNRFLSATRPLHQNDPFFVSQNNGLRKFASYPPLSEDMKPAVDIEFPFL